MADKQPDLYAKFNAPLIARNVASLHTPRLYPSAINEFGEYVEDMLTRGDIVVDPENGQPLTANGQTIEQLFADDWLKKRGHAIIPVLMGDEDDEAAKEAWTSGNLTLQGARLRHFEATVHSKAAAKVLWQEEAQRYSAKAGSTISGTLPDDNKVPKSLSHDSSTSNPWHKNFRGDDAARDARIASIIKVQGTALALSLAKSAGTSIGKPLRK